MPNMNSDEYKLSAYNYIVPQELIAQFPVFPRDECRLLIVDRSKKTLRQSIFKDVLDFLREGDVLVLNNTKVIKARLTARKQTGGKVEILLLKKQSENVGEALVKPGKKVRTGDILIFDDNDSGIKITAQVLSKTVQNLRVLQFSSGLEKILDQIGKVPLPPYIKKEVDEFSYYQTIYAKEEGAVAAPTAGLHFTPRLIKQIEDKGVKIVYVTLHCGLATFRPVKTEDIRQHKIESEWVEITPPAAEMINAAKKQGQRVIAAGTTSIRTLETAAISDKERYVRPFTGNTSLYIVPGYKFKVVDAVITNFHTPCSTNLILTASFCGGELLKKSYDYAVINKFRFYSFGDGMLIL